MYSLLVRYWRNQAYPASIPLGILHRVLRPAFHPVEASQQDIGLCDQITVAGKQAALRVLVGQHRHHISPVNALLPAGAMYSLIIACVPEDIRKRARTWSGGGAPAKFGKEFF